jgi:dihydrofolate reductase
MNAVEVKTRFIACAAVSEDGYIARDIKHNSYDWTSPEDKKNFRNLITGTHVDVCVWGYTTYELHKKSIPLLLHYDRIVFKGRDIVKSGYIQQISDAEVFLDPGEKPDRLLAYCAQKRYHNALVLGGSQVYAWFVEQGLLDEFYLTTEPVAFGGGIPLLHNGKQLHEYMKVVEMSLLNDQGTVLERYIPFT